MITAPTIDTRIRTDVTSKANECVVKSCVPIAATELIAELVKRSREEILTVR